MRKSRRWASGAYAPAMGRAQGQRLPIYDPISEPSELLQAAAELEQAPSWRSDVRQQRIPSVGQAP